MRTVIVKASLETLAPRIVKNAQVLSSNGNEVTVLSWDRDNKNLKREKNAHYQAVRFKLRAPYGSGILFFLPLWWTFEFIWLISHSWDVVHAVDFDTLPPAVLAAKIKRKPVIYEIADYYTYLIPLPSFITKTSNFIDRIFMQLSSAIISASELKIGGLEGIPDKKIAVIYGSPPDLLTGIPRSVNKNGSFSIFYSGALHKDRQLNLDKLILAIRAMDKVNLTIAGYGTQVDELKHLIEGSSNVQFIGKISYTQVLQNTIGADLLIAIHQPVNFSSRCNISNKVFEAMMAGKPILVNVGTEMARFIDEIKCGLAINGNNILEIKEAVLKFKENPELCRHLGENGRQAYEQKYSWKIMEQRLLGLYSKINHKDRDSKL